MRLIFFSILITISSTLLAGNGILKGIITDNETKEPLIGAVVTTQSGEGVASDYEGKYELVLAEGKYLIKIEYTGYSKIEKEIVLNSGETKELSIGLETENQFLDDIVVSGSLYARNASEEVMSIEVVKPEFIDKTNSIRFDDLARKVPGLNVVDGQANIRAGSGWSYGVGSRVAIIVDGQAMLSPDRQDIKWVYLPTELAGQVEVTKGAGSVLYGSSAMNGTISIQTIKPTTTPKTKISVYTTVFDRPKREITQWNRFPRTTVGIYFSTAKKVNPNFEYILGGHMYIQNQYYEGGRDNLARLSFGTKWTNKKDSSFVYGLRGNITYDRETEFFFWQDKDNGFYRPAELNDHEFFRINLDPYMIKYDKKNNKHDIKGRIFFLRPEYATRATFINTDYTFSKHYPTNWTVIAGASNTYVYVKEDAFGGAFNGDIAAVFTQIDKKWDKISLTGGARFEFFKFGDIIGLSGTRIQDEQSNSKFFIPGMFRTGINYQPIKNSFIRFNVGQAYRFPSLAERYVEKSLGPINVFSNPEVKPEFGWTGELGYEKKIKKPHYEGSLDLALFWQEYTDMIEFKVGIYVPDTLNVDSVNIIDYLGFKAVNVSNARIGGYELNLRNNFIINKNHNLQLALGYTYAYPIDLNADTSLGLKKVGVYLKNLFQGMRQTENLQPQTLDAILKYRNRHLGTFDIEYNYKNDLSVGINGRYYSSMESVDDLFRFFIKGIGEYFDENYGKGELVLDGRISYTVKDRHTFGIVVKNFLNNEYALRPARPDAPRSYTLTYKINL